MNQEINLQTSPIDLDLSAEENLQKMVVELSQQGFSVRKDDLDAMRQAIVEAINSVARD